MKDITIEEAAVAMQNLRRELSKILIGQQEVVELLVTAMLSGGHVLLTGAPGLGKTLLVKSIAQLFSLSFKRIQFTPDLMPADIFGTEMLEENRETGVRSFRFVKGPVFANLVLADEINRTPPKTQAALLEAMGEGHVTAAGNTYKLQEPFFVLATQNPIEQEGTYPLPEAQLDRFLLNAVMDYLDEADEIRMVKQTTSAAGEQLHPVMDAAQVLEAQRLVREIPVSDNVVSYAVRICAATRPSLPGAPEIVKEMVRWGAGSRASQAMILAGKARALLDGRRNPACEDIRALAVPVLRHRIIMNFRGDSEGISSTDVVREVLSSVKEG